METIFDHNPTRKELKELFNFDEKSNSMAHGFSIVRLKNEDYEKESTPESRLLDIALLLDYRGLTTEADNVWRRIPDIALQYKMGKDYLQIPT